MNNTYIQDYRKAIRSGEIVAGRELIDELDNLIRDMADDRYIFDTTDADQRIDFMEHCIRLTKSPFYGKPMKLLLWQKAFITAVYSFKMADETYIDPSGREKHVDRFKKCVLLIARKNAKSETCSGLTLTEAIVGNEGADLVCSSNDDTQANILYDAIDTMRLMIDPEQKDTWRNQKWIRINDTNSKIFKISDRTRNKEGRNIDFSVIDEVHEMKENTIIKSIEQSQSLKDNPKLIIITTEGFVNDGALDEILRQCRRVIRGEDDGASAERLLPWLYTQDSEQEIWADERSWQKSNPSLGVIKKYTYLREQIDAARKSTADRAFVLSKDFNIKQNAAAAWLHIEDYAYNAEYDLEDFRGSLILGGVDMSETTDMTSARALVMRAGDKLKYIIQHYWIPESKLTSADDREAGAKYKEWAKAGILTICEGNDIDLSQVADWYYMLYKQYGLRLFKCGYDVKFSKDFLKRMDEYGFECELVYQSKQVLSNAMKLVEADFKAQLINYNNNEIDKWCLGNAAVEVDNAGNCQAVKIKGQPAKRIDGAVTFIIAYEIFRRYRSEYMQMLR
ncbi:MAG: terminase large subunit [Lachnospiraceae bacterium]|nr:terminase large subunit [Lachnospiraceae bacterium]MBQ5825205.1 terminase large subunit [Clostridia bacterium]